MADLNDVKIGTSGYSFLDWVGPFYPDDIQKGRMLDFYVQHFDIVEINSSYYRIPHPRVFENMEKKTPPNFEFIVKTHRSVTHDRKDVMAQVDAYRESIKPLVDAGKLRGLLLQFPYSFRWSQQNLSYLARIIGLLDSYPLYFEFRHRGWQRDELFALFEKSKISLCSVDGPQISALPRHDLFEVSRRIYLRLHGRNAEQWWDGGALRYDYLYTEKQLKSWIDKIREAKRATGEIYIFFNNCHRGQAVQNAKMMKELIQLDMQREHEEQ
jgi:uncharacterized protein YecE (DUF72 family)